MADLTRTFTREELEAIGVPDKWTADEGQLAKRLHEEQLDTRRWVSVRELIFRAPDDGKAYRVTYEQGLTENQEDTDPWNGDDEIKAVEVREQQVTVTKWVPVVAAEVTT